MATVRSVLFMPGNHPGMLVSADTLGADAVIFDLEDAVALTEKDAARALTAGALATLPRDHSQVVVRINPLDSPYWEADLEAIVPHKPDALILPKATPAGLVQLAQAMADRGLSSPPLWPLLESPVAIVSLAEFRRTTLPIEALLLGGEDYAQALGVARTASSVELRYAESTLVTYAKAYGWRSYDTPFTDITDRDGLVAHVSHAKALGFDGVLCIHPSQVDVVSEVYRPSDRDAAWAQGVAAAYREAKATGQGVFSYGGKMVDRPVLLRARAVIEAMGGSFDVE